MKRFITFEGGEGSGKTTQIKHLAKRLFDRDDFNVVVTRDPGGSEFAAKIRGLLLDPAHSSVMDVRTEFLLFLAARRQLITEVIMPALSTGKIVLCDRFSDSSFVYQMLVRGACTYAEFLAFHEYVLGTGKGRCFPGLTILLDIDPVVGMARVSKRAERANLTNESRFDGEELEFHKKIRKGFLTLASSWPGRIKKVAGDISDSIASDCIKEVRIADNIYQVVKQHFLVHNIRGDQHESKNP